MTLGHQHSGNSAAVVYWKHLRHDRHQRHHHSHRAAQLSSAQLDVIVEALSGYAEACRVNGPTPELNKLIDALDARINSDFAEN